MLPSAIYWFEEVDFRVAKSVWDGASKKNNSAADPLRGECEYFRWPNPYRTRGPARFNGYTHRKSPLGIMINVDLRGEALLEAIAHERFHIYQDSSHPQGWRDRETPATGEADEWVRSKSSEIQMFLKHWEEDRPTPTGDLRLVFPTIWRLKRTGIVSPGTFLPAPGSISLAGLVNWG